MNPYKVKMAGCCGLLILLILQFIFTRVVLEPFPSVILPSFASIPKYKTHFKTKRFAITAADSDQRVIEVPPEILLKGMPPATQYHLIKRICAPKKDFENYERHKSNRSTVFRRFKIYLRDDLAKGYYRKDAKNIKPWLLDLLNKAYGPQKKFVTLDV